MSDRVALSEGRVVPRLALTGLALVWLSGCSADVTRFDTKANPFSNPFSSQTAMSTSAPGAAPAGQVAATPLPTSSALPPSAGSPATAASQAVGGSSTGWTAVGGTPIMVAQGETLDTVSRRYGVPTAALLSANGLTTASEVRGGMRMIVPVYNAGGRAIASAAPVKPDAESAKKREEVASRDDSESKLKKTKSDEKDMASEKEKTAKADKEKDGEKGADKLPQKDKTKPEDKVAEAKAGKTDAGKAALQARKGIDTTPTGNLEAAADDSKKPVSGAQADAAGVEPEFRWPARGRIIEGFKAGGNDGINIAVPAGTSVRAAESGVVVYSGDGLKGYGNLVLIKHPNGFVSAYANNGELDVKRGEQVKRGQIIAKSGDTGNVNAPQLHFELRKGSTPVDPTQYLAGL